MEITKEVLLSLMVGVSLAAASGFRLFIPLLIGGLAVRFGFQVPWISEVIPDSAGWLGSTPALVAFGAASAIEVISYKIPFVDNILDLLTTPTAIAVGTLLTATFLSGVENPLMKLGIGVLLGGGAAGAIQTSTAALRVLSTKTTAGLGNPVVSTMEGFFSLVISILAVVAPIFALAVIFGLFYFFFWLFKRLLQKLQAQARAL